MTIPNPCEQLVRDYVERLRGGFTTSLSDRGCFIVTPFIRPDGEVIEVATEMQPDRRIRLTDMGDTLGYLYVNGLTLSRGILESTRRICRRFGVSVEGTELAIALDDRWGLGESLHRLIQAVLSVTDLIQKRRSMARVNFDGEVESLIIGSGVVYDAEYKVQGERSLHEIRFHVNTGRHLLIQPLTAASESAAFQWAERWAYRFRDIQERNRSWNCVAMVDDRGERAQVWNARAIAPIQEYVVPWVGKERLSEMLR